MTEVEGQLKYSKTSYQGHLDTEILALEFDFVIFVLFAICRLL